MNGWIKVFFAVTLLFSSVVDGSCGTDVRGLVRGALKTLGTQRGDVNLCVLTDSTYVNLAGRSTEEYVDMVEKETGCSVGKGNLLLFRRPSNYHLIIALYKRDTKECVVIRYDGQEGRVGKLHIGDEYVYEPDFWKKASTGVSGSDTSGIVSILRAWSLGAPYDFLKSAEIHGDACPGLAWGYFTAKAVQKQYPLRTGEEYVFIACPTSCKDDAILVLLGVTPGKRTLFVKKLTEEQRKQLSEEKGAGILVKWNQSQKRGEGAVLAIDMDKIRQTISYKTSSKPNAKAMNIAQLIPHLNSSEEFIKVVREFAVTPELMEGLMSAGKNPYEVIGPSRKPVRETK
jgi:formylmethanofuran dehydrogenase subunit E-like metal-binding protein